MSISFVLPMYNEKKNIRKSIEGLRSVAGSLTDDYEIIVVDDGSTDGSAALVEEMADRDKRLKCIPLGENTRFAGALKKGLQSARKEIIIYTDSDLSIDWNDIKNILPLIENADIVNAFSPGQKGESLSRVFISIGYNFLVNFIFHLHIRDINSSFKIFRRSVFQGMSLVSESPFIDAEIFLRARQRGCSILQAPMVFKDREKGKSTIARPSVIFYTFRDMLKFYFAHHNGQGV